MYNILYLLNYCAVLIECQPQSRYIVHLTDLNIFFRDTRVGIWIIIYLYFFFFWFFPFGSRCQLFYFYAPLSDRLPLIVPPHQEPAGRKFLINSPSARPQDWSIPGQTRQGYCSSFRSRPPLCVLDKKSLTHTTAAVCPSTRSINVWRSPTRKAFLGGGGAGIWSIALPTANPHPRKSEDRRPETVVSPYSPLPSQRPVGIDFIIRCSEKKLPKTQTQGERQLRPVTRFVWHAIHSTHCTDEARGAKVLRPAPRPA